MLAAVVILTVLPAVIKCSGEGNIKLLEEDVKAAIKACLGDSKPRTRRAENFGYDEQYADNTPRIDSKAKGINQYGHEKRNGSENREQLHALNASEYEYGTVCGSGGYGQKENSTGCNQSSVELNRTRRSEPLFTKDDIDQCLSQCVFANLQVVDVRGIPREAELWSKIQSSVTSQQSRAALRDQVSACFQELQSEAEDNGCSYSNKLERCLMLRFTDRKNAISVETTPKN